MKRTKILLILGTMVLSVLLLSACESEVESIKSDIVGEWLTEIQSQKGLTLTETLVFHPNGQFSCTSELIRKDNTEDKVNDIQTGNGTYSLNGDTITLTYSQITGSIELPPDILSEDLMGTLTSGPVSYNFAITGNKLKMKQDGGTHSTFFVRGTL